MTMVVTKFRRFQYNNLLMGICSSREIFQAKVDQLIGYIEGVKAYIDDILVFCKEEFSKFTDQLRVIFSRLCSAGLKEKAPKVSFWSKDIP